MSVLTADSRRDLEIHRYPVLVYGLVPLVALVLQAWLPRLLGQFAWFDLPLVVTVYFALGRRSPIQGTLMGCAVGLFEDALTHHAIGINGIAKTVAGIHGRVGRHTDRCGEPHYPRRTHLPSFAVVQRHLHLREPLPARPGA